MARKTYKQYKQDPYVRLPIVAWILDRSAIYIALALVFILGTGFWLTKGFESLQRVQAEAEVYTPYQDITAVATPGKDWAINLASQAPPNVNAWELKEASKPEQIVDQTLCRSLGDLPASTQSTTLASGDNVNLSIQLYGAGQASKQFEAYKEPLSKCFNAAVEDREGFQVISWANGFSFTMGDSILTISTPRSDLLPELYNFYRTKTEETLVASMCRQLFVPATDATRSFFYNAEEFTGLQESTELDTQVDLTEIPNPTSVTITDIANPNLTAPEGPLPENFPTLPSETTKPTLPTSPNSDGNFTASVIYQIIDTEGPGCGWEWSGQKSPVFDIVELEAEKAELINAKQDEVNNSAKAYVSERLNWSFTMAATVLKVEKWNIYVNQVNSVHNQWSWLENERNNIRAPWYNYVEAHDSWRTFDARKAEAQNAYNQAIATCTAQNDAYQTWLNQYGPDSSPTITPPPTSTPTATPTLTPTPTSTPTPTVPPAPERCEVQPTPPEILSQVKPNEPMEPAIPNGVTIPDSWPKAQR